MDDVEVLRQELHNVQTLMMSDINEIKADTKLDESRNENESLKSELSTIALQQAADSKSHKLEISYLQEEKDRLLRENEKLSTKVETFSLGLNSAEENATTTRRELDQVRSMLHH